MNWKHVFGYIPSATCFLPTGQGQVIWPNLVKSTCYSFEIFVIGSKSFIVRDETFLIIDEHVWFNDMIAATMSWSPLKIFLIIGSKRFVFHFPAPLLQGQDRLTFAIADTYRPCKRGAGKCEKYQKWNFAYAQITCPATAGQTPRNFPLPALKNVRSMFWTSFPGWRDFWYFLGCTWAMIRF